MAALLCPEWLPLPALAQAPATTEAASDAAPSEGNRLILLIPVLTGETTPQDRRVAAAEILALASDDATKALAGILTLKNNTAAKIAICEAVAETTAPPPALAEPLLGLVGEQKEQAVRDAAVSALLRFSDPAVTARLKQVLEREEMQWLRTEMVARSRELYALLPKETDRVARLLTWLKAAQPIDRLTALEIVHDAMLAATPTVPANEVLQQIRLMLRDPDADVRRKLVVVLRDLQEKEDAARIAGMLKFERSPVVLEEIYKAIGRMGDPSAIGACIRGLDHPADSVAAGAADALGRLCRRVNGQSPEGTDQAVQALIDRVAAGIENDNLRDQVIGAMAEIADPRFLPVLQAHAGTSEKLPQIRQAALTGIGQIGDPNQVELVVTCLAEDPDAGVREAAALALGKLGSKPMHLRPLFLRLNEPSPTVQTRAWEAYRAVFARLPWADRLAALATWTGTDKATIARRIDLLSDLETQAAVAKADVKQLMTIREELGDALAAAGEHALAAAAYTRAMEGLAAEQAEIRMRLAGKLLTAYLNAPALDKAVTLASATADTPGMLEHMAEQLHTYVEARIPVDPQAAADCMARFRADVPGLFTLTPEWSKKFGALQRATTQPSATLPTSSG